MFPNGAASEYQIHLSNMNPLKPPPLIIKFSFHNLRVTKGHVVGSDLTTEH